MSPPQLLVQFSLRLKPLFNHSSRLYSMGMVGKSTPRVTTLQETPTWAVATVCCILIMLSILLEHLLQLLTKFLEGQRRKSLNRALTKIKDELILLGFISLFLTVAQQPISKICIPKSVGETFLPCKGPLRTNVAEEPTCQVQGKVSFMSRNGINQLHILIFVMGLFHVLSSVLTLGLGIAKMRKWESWEEETTTLEYEFSNDPRRFRFTTQTSFGRQHLKFWSERPLLLWPVSFLRLFTGSVSRADYFTLRHGFIAAHISQGSKFNFQKFLRRSLDMDFSVVVGISLWIWIFSTFFLFFTAHRFYNYLWLPFLPLVMVLMVGTKLQVIITKMCLESREESVVVRGTFLVKPSDHYFWFGRPHFLLHLIHLILFQNSFQLAFFTWTWYKFGLRSCFHRETEDIVIRIAMSVLVQLLIGYVILPLFGLVTQMGSTMNKMVFTDRVSTGLKNWHVTAKRKLGTSYKSNPNSPRVGQSPSHSTETSLSHAPEWEMTDPQHPLPHAGSAVAVEIVEVGRTMASGSKKSSDGGEISFRF